MKRILTLMMICLALALLLTGCASNADTQPSASPGMNTTGPMATVSPQTTGGGMLGGGILDGTGTPTSGERGLLTAEEALTASKELRDSVQKLTEVDTAAAVATGTTALVGVTFDSSYQGQVDDRLTGMVLERARSVFPGIQAVAVTNDAGMLSEISSLYQMLQNGTPYATVKSNADTLAKSLDLYRD